MVYFNYFNGFHLHNQGFLSNCPNYCFSELHLCVCEHNVTYPLPVSLTALASKQALEKYRVY